MANNTQPYWKVLKEPTNGMKIAGQKGRKAGALFQAPEPLVRFLVLEGIVGECDAQGNVKVAAPAAPTSPSQGLGSPSSTSSSSSSGSSPSGGSSTTSSPIP